MECNEQKYAEPVLSLLWYTFLFWAEEGTRETFSIVKGFFILGPLLGNGRNFNPRFMHLAANENAVEVRTKRLLHAIFCPFRCPAWLPLLGHYFVYI